MKKKITIILMAAATLCAVLTGCGKKDGDSEDSGEKVKEEIKKEDSAKSDVSDDKTSYNVVADEFNTIYLEMDEITGEYLAALDSVKAFIDGESSKKETLEVLNSTIDDFMEQYEVAEEYIASNELETALSKTNTDESEFEAFGNFKFNLIGIYALNLNGIAMLMEDAEVDDIMIKFVSLDYDLYLEQLEIDIENYFYCTNDVFVHWSKENAQMLIDAMTDCKYLCAEGFEWLDSKEKTINKQEEIMEKYDEWEQKENDFIIEQSKEAEDIKEKLAKE